MSEQNSSKQLAHDTDAVDDVDSAKAKLLEQLERMFNLSLDLIGAGNLDGYFTKVNATFTELLGYTEETLISRPFLSFIHDDDVVPTKEALLSAVNGETNIFVENRYRCEDGSYRWIEWKVFADAEAHNFIAVGREVTERKRNEAALSESEEKYRTLFEDCSDSILIHDREGRITQVNQKALEFFGMGRDEMLSSHIMDLVSEESIEKAHQYLQVLARRGNVAFETTGKRSNGELIPVEVSSNALGLQGDRMIQSVVRDISERKKLEEERLKVQKLESIGVLAGGIAHDFNNLLMAVLGNISVARSSVPEGSPAQERLRAAEKASVRAQELTLQLLTFSKGGEPVRKQARLDGLLSDSISFALSGSNVKSTLAVAADLRAVFIDEGQIGQVIQNVVKNAEQAMPSGGTVIVRAENKTVNREDELPVEPGRYVVVSVADTGVGILEKHLARVFDPYFTTKDGGSGLGLASAYAIVKKHDGFITVDSARGEGTTFHIYLPAAEGTPPESSVASGAELHGQGRILVMDDEQIILDVTTQMLKRMGYTSQSARNGHEALALYKEAYREDKPFDAVILDLTVPGGMGGKETIDELRRFDPDVRAIVSSGYANDPIMADCRERGFRGVLSKPYDAQRLGTVLREVLD